MKIKTITCHNVYNYGASLQAYALMKYLMLRENEVEIIDFQPDHLKVRYNFLYVSPLSRFYPLCKKSKFFLFVYAAFKNSKMYKTYGRKRKFDDFTRKYLSLTKDQYNTSEELKENPPVADLYIAGSDQIWNTNSENGKQTAFYLDFGPDNTVRASYAASFAVKSIEPSLIDFVKEKLCRLDHISIREQSGLAILNDLGIENGVQVLDPVFLLSAETWTELLEVIPVKEKYLLVYDFLHDDPKVEIVVKHFAKKYDLKIYSINDFKKLSYADKNFSAGGPLEFMELIKSAELVISNSFHATAFCAIFHTPFWVFPLRKFHNSSRMVDFLDLINLSYRFDPIVEKLDEVDISIDWNEVDQSLEKKKNESLRFLDKVLINTVD